MIPELVEVRANWPELSVIKKKKCFEIEKPRSGAPCAVAVAFMTLSFSNLSYCFFFTLFYYFLILGFFFFNLDLETSLERHIQFLCLSQDNLEGVKNLK